MNREELSNIPGAPNVVGNSENDINTTLVGSNNISLNKRVVVKRDTQFKQGHGHATSLATSAMATASLAFSQNGIPKKEQILSTKINTTNSHSLSPITNPNTGQTLSPVAAQSILHPITLSNTSNQFIQLIQTPQFVTSQPNNTTINQHEPSQGFSLVSSMEKDENSLMQVYGQKLFRGPPQILPKPQSPALQASAEKLVITESKTFHLQQTEKFLHPTQLSSLNSSSSDASSQGGSIILPPGNLNNQPLFLNQPVVVQQAVPPGVQIVLKHPTSAMTGASIVIQHPRIPLQPSMPHQVLRIVNSNTTMHISSPPAILFSTQQNLMQSNLPNMKNNSQSNPITQIDTLQLGGKTQSIAASMNNNLLGQSVTQLQNLQVSENLSQIPISNGLNGSFIQPVQSHFQQTFPDFNQICQNISVGQLHSGTLQQIPNIATATLQSSCQQFDTEIEIHAIGSKQNHPPTGNIQTITPALQSTSESLYSMASEATDMKNIVIYCKGGFPVSEISTYDSSNASEINIKPKRKLKKKGKNSVESFPKTKSANSTVGNFIETNNLVQTDKNVEESHDSFGQAKRTRKLDLANVMKLCGILEEDEFTDADVDQSLQKQAQTLNFTNLKTKIGLPESSQTVLATVNDNININIPNISDEHILAPIPVTQNDANMKTIFQNSINALKQNKCDLKTDNFFDSHTAIKTNQSNPCLLPIKHIEKKESAAIATSHVKKLIGQSSPKLSKNDTISRLLPSPIVPISVNLMNSKSRQHISSMDEETNRCNGNMNIIRSTPSTVQTVQDGSLDCVPREKRTNIQQVMNIGTIGTKTYGKNSIKQNFKTTRKNLSEQKIMKNRTMPSQNSNGVVEHFRVCGISRKSSTLQVPFNHNPGKSFSEQMSTEQTIEKDVNLPAERNLKVAKGDVSKLIFQTFLNGALFNVTFVEKCQEETIKSSSPESNKLSVTSPGSNFHQLKSKVILPKPSTNTLLQNKVLENHTIFNGPVKCRENFEQVSETPNRNDQNLLFLQGKDFVALPTIMPDSQFFPINATTNQLKHLCASQTTPVLKQGEQLLIGSAGTDIQQMSQCGSQGQILFENVEGAINTSEPKTKNNSVLVWTTDHEIVHPNLKHVVHPFHQTQAIKQVANVAPMMDVSKTKRVPRVKKPKSFKHKNDSEIDKISSKSQSIFTNITCKNPIQVVQPNVSKMPQRSVKALPTFSSLPSSASSCNINQYHQQLGTKLVAVTAPIQKNFTKKNTDILQDLKQINSNKNRNDEATSPKLELQSLHKNKQDILVVKKLNGALSQLRLATGIENLKYSESKRMEEPNQNETSLGLGLKRNVLSQHQQQMLKNLELQIQQFSEKLQNKNFPSSAKGILSETNKGQNIKPMPQSAVNNVTIEAKSYKNLSTSTGTCLDLDCDTSSKLKTSSQTPDADSLQLGAPRQEIPLLIRIQDKLQSDNEQPIGEISTKREAPSIEHSYNLTGVLVDASTIAPLNDNNNKSAIVDITKNVNERLNGTSCEKQNSETAINLLIKNNKNNNSEEVFKLNQLMNHNFGEQIADIDRHIIRGLVHCRPDKQNGQRLINLQQKNCLDCDHCLESSTDKLNQKDNRKDLHEINQTNHWEQKCEKQSGDMSEQKLDVEENSQIIHQQPVKTSQESNSVKVSVSPAIFKKRYSETIQQKQHNFRLLTEKEGNNTFLNSSEKMYQISPKRKLSIHKFLPQEQCKLSTFLNKQLNSIKIIKQKFDQHKNENATNTAQLVSISETLATITDHNDIKPPESSGTTKIEFHESLAYEALHNSKTNTCTDKSLFLDSNDRFAGNLSGTGNTRHKVLSYPSSEENMIVSAQVEPKAQTKKSNIPFRFLFERQLRVDQEGCVSPDYNTPFISKEEAIKRLIRFHCMYQEFDDKLSDAGDELQYSAIKLQKKYHNLSERFQQLMFHESMRSHETSEICLMNRLFVSDIQSELSDLRANVCSGDTLTGSSQVKPANNSCYNSRIRKEEYASFQVHDICLQRLSGQNASNVQLNSDDAAQMSLQLYRYEDQNTVQLPSSNVSQKKLHGILESNHDCLCNESNLSKKNLWSRTTKVNPEEMLTVCPNAELSPIKSSNSIQILHNREAKSSADLYNVHCDQNDRAMNKRKNFFPLKKCFKSNSYVNQKEVTEDINQTFFTESSQKSYVGISCDHSSDDCNGALKTSPKNTCVCENNSDGILDLCKNFNQNFQDFFAQNVGEGSTTNAKNDHFINSFSAGKDTYINRPRDGENSGSKIVDIVSQSFSKEKSHDHLDAAQSFADESNLNKFFEQKRDSSGKETRTVPQTVIQNTLPSFPLKQETVNKKIRNNKQENIKIIASPQHLKRLHKQHLLRSEKRHKGDYHEKATRNISDPLQKNVSSNACTAQLLQPQTHTVYSTSSQAKATFSQTEKSSCKTKKRDIEIISSCRDAVPEKKSCISEKRNMEFTSFEKYLNAENNQDSEMRNAQRTIDYSSFNTGTLTQIGPKIQDANFLHHVYAGNTLDCCLRVQNKSVQTSENICILNPLHEIPTSSLLDEPMNPIPANLKHDHSSSNEKIASASFSSNFDEDINRHVQHAIDTILHLQNCENNSMDSCVSPNLVDNTVRASYADVKDTVLVNNSVSNCGSNKLVPSFSEGTDYCKKINQRDKVSPPQKVILTPNNSCDDLSDVEVNMSPTIYGVTSPL